jgi:hypothetical protein
MKTSYRVYAAILLGFGLVYTWIMFSCTQPPQAVSKNKVTIEDDRILIHPGVAISDADRTAMNAILKHYSKSLYKISTYQKGKVVSTEGRLSDMHIDKALASEVALAADQGFSDSVIQIACRNGQNRPPLPSPPPASTDRPHLELPRPSAPPTTTDTHPHPPTKPPTRTELCDSDELTDLVAILRKYSTR